MFGHVYEMKDSWLVVVLHKTSWGRIVTSFPSILYFVVDMLFKTNGRIHFLNSKKNKNKEKCVTYFVRVPIEVNAPTNYAYIIN